MNESNHLIARLRFRHLQLLSEVQARGSLRAAAQALNLTQPALSKALTEIERAFGFTLFVRTPRGLTPTAQGEVVLKGATQLLGELTFLRTEAEHAGRFCARIRVGAPPFLAQTFLPDVIAKLVKRQMPVRVHLLEERVPALLSALHKGELDALISTFPLQMLQSEAEALEFTRLFDVQFAVVAAKDHPLARARRTDWSRLSQEPWVMPVEGSMGRRLIEDCFTRVGIPVPLPVIEATSPTTSMQFVASGLGIGIVPNVTLIQHSSMQANPVKQIRVLPEPPPSVVALIVREGSFNPRVALLKEVLDL